MKWSVMGSAGAGDEQERALRALYEEQADPLYTYVVRLLGGDRYRAEDIVQETLLRCWRRQDLGVGGQLLRPWLFRVARNLVIDGHRRRLARPHEIDGGNWLAELSDEADEIEELLSSVVVGEALKALAPAHREVLYETYFVGRTTQEAAVALGVPQGTVKSRVFYALRALRLALEERGVAVGGSRPARAARA
ncbi:sigma-70 family RNA polymerase sigma factor [Streptomyces sp. CA-135486]|uniref:sigma-70 family RNA polymerase sigma factor n=1 Tax=Streptomyces sp. CA-135486 TaxID=3240049 RepID=UPI003D8CDDE4